MNTQQMVDIEIGEYANGKEAVCVNCNGRTYLNERLEEYCPKCVEITNYCNYAEKEGYADCSEMTWGEKVAYYNYGLSHDGMEDECEDWGDRESDLQAEIGGGN